MQAFMKYWVSLDNGAPPLNIARILPPSISFVFLNINLKRQTDRERVQNDDTKHFYWMSIDPLLQFKENCLLSSHIINFSKLAKK